MQAMEGAILGAFRALGQLIAGLNHMASLQAWLRDVAARHVAAGLQPQHYDFLAAGSVTILAQVCIHIQCGQQWLGVLITL